MIPQDDALELESFVRAQTIDAGDNDQSYR